MLKTLLTKGPDKVFVVIKNGSGSALSAGQVVEWKATSGVIDGVTVTNPSATGCNLVVGNADAATPDGEYGLAQTYGYDDDAIAYHHGTATNDGGSVGDALVVASAISGWSGKAAGAATIIHPYLAAMGETAAFASSSATATTNAKVFLRMM